MDFILLQLLYSKVVLKDNLAHEFYDIKRMIDIFKLMIYFIIIIIQLLYFADNDGFNWNLLFHRIRNRSLTGSFMRHNVI